MFRYTVDFAVGVLRNGLIRVDNLQQNLQQTCAFRLLLRHGCASASIISLYLTVVNHLLTNTYKTPERIRNPLLYPTELRALNYLSAYNVTTS